MIKHLKGYYQYNQEDCGAACLATILSYYGKKTTISVLRNVMLYDKNGANVLSIIDTANSYGLGAEAYEGNFKELNQKINQENFKLPLILHVEREKIGGHYIVLKKISKNKIKVFDPKNGHLNLSKDEFLKQWTGVVICFEMNESKEGTQENFNILKNSSRYLKILLSKKKILLTTIILSIIVSIISLIGSWIYKIIIDDYILNNLDILAFQFTILFLSLLFFYFFQFGLFFGKNVLVSKISKSISNSLSKSFLQHLLCIPEKNLFYFETGDILSRFQNVVQIQQSSLKIIFTLTTELIGVIIGSVILFSLSSQLFLYVIIMLIVYTLIFLVSFPFLNKIRKKYYSLYSESITKLNQTINGRSTILMQNRNHWFLNRILNKVKGTNQQLFNLGVTESTMSSLIMLTESIGSLAILWKGSLLVMNNDLSLGSLIVFQSMLNFFISPVQQLVLIQNEIQNFSILIQRLNDLYVIKPEISFLPILKKEEIDAYNINLSNITFSYYYSRNIFENINFEIVEGSKVGVIGESGSGKTTLIKIIATLYPPSQGDIYLGNKEYKSFSLEKLREIIAYVPQDPFIIEGTLIDNLIMGSFLDKEKQLMLNKVVRIFDLHNLNLKEYNDLGMFIYENGSNLSGGQKQKIGLARAIIKNPQILLLDESTSNIDNQSKQRILSYLYSIKDLSIISVSHDESIYSYSKQFLMIKKDKISLMNKEESYTYAKKNYVEEFYDVGID